MDRFSPSPACFEGHFPGNPILPGITQVAWAAQRLAQKRPGTVLQRVAHVRLRQLVRPEEELALIATKTADGSQRFELRRDQTVVTNGVLRFSDGFDAEQTEQHFGLPAESGAFPAIETLLPHRPPMRFVTRVRAHEDKQTACEAAIPPECAIIDDGRAPVLAAVEACAQAAAVHERLRSMEELGASGAGSGYLVSLRDIELAADTLPAGHPFVAIARLESAALPLASYEIAAFLNDRLLLRGRIGTFLASGRD